MRYETITSIDLLRLIENGWFVAWFGVGEDEEENDYAHLRVDLCANWRLMDGKIMFRQVDLTDKDNGDPKELVSKIAALATDQWVQELESNKQGSLAVIGNLTL